MLSLNGDLTSTRDLRVYPDSTSLGRLAYAGAPVPAGRAGRGGAGPHADDHPRAHARLSSWLRPRFTTSSNFLLSRTLTSRVAGAGGR